jgi:hypothetical protein
MKFTENHHEIDSMRFISEHFGSRNPMRYLLAILKYPTYATIVSAQNGRYALRYAIARAKI